MRPSIISFAARGRYWLRGSVLALLLAHESLAALTFDFRYVDDANGTLASRGWLDSDSLFQRNIAAAAVLWGAEFDSDETVIVKVDPISFTARAGGTGTLGRSLYVNGQGKVVWEVGALTRILTGDNPSEEFYGYDVLLGFDASYIETHYWFDSEPESRTTPVPVDKGDFLSVVLHELGHGFGMTGFRNFSTGQIVGDDATRMDDLSHFGGNGQPIGPDGERNPMFFSGDTATRLFGGDLPLTHKPPEHPLYGQSFFHLSACDLGGDGLEDTLMNGCAIPNGQRLHITPIDLAIVADIGYPLANVFGDYNGDGSVDAADYVLWRKQLGATLTSAGYNVWRSSFGLTSVRPTPSLSALPEAPALMLLAWAATLLLPFPYRKTRSVSRHP